jgi:hypothetical protein
MPTITMNVTFSNRGPSSVPLVVEPWAEEFVVPPGSSEQLSIHAPELGEVEIQRGEAISSVWVWQGCTVSIRLDGKDISSPALSIPAFG